MFCTLGNQKKKKKREKANTHTRRLRTPGSSSAVFWGALSDTPSSGQRVGFGCSTLCAGPHSLSRVPLLSVSTCMCACGRCGWPCQEAPPASLGRLASVTCTGRNYEHKKGEFLFGTRDTADVPLFCGCSCTFLSSECVNLYTWCENSSINVYQENGTKTKNVTF